MIDPTDEPLERRIAAYKAELDALRALHPDLVPRLHKQVDVELTYSSNAIEGNTLSLRETAEVIEHGITVGGKTLRDHLEAVDHYDAVRWVRALAAGETALDEATVTDLHRRIVLRSQPEIAGSSSAHRRRVVGSRAVFPNPAKVPELMARLGLRRRRPKPRRARRSTFTTSSPRSIRSRTATGGPRGC